MKFLLPFFFTVIIINLTLGQPAKERLEIKNQTFTSASGKEVRAEVGSLIVPENRASKESANIKIKFVRLKSTNPNPKAPVVYLEGGPGSSCTWQAGNPRYLDLWAQFLEVSDIILMDQRGTGEAAERLTWIWKEPLPEDLLVDAAVANKHFQRVCEKALVAFKERGVQLEGYTTKENAVDIEELRKALGLDKISLYGFSYGTHLGLAYIRYFGSKVENAILVGTEGPNHNYKLPSAMDVQFRKIALLAKEDSGVNSHVPDLITLYERVIRKIEKQPISIEIPSPLTRQPMMVKIGPFGLNMLLRFDIGDASDIPVIPRLLYSIDQGDYSILKWFVRKRITAGYGINAMSATTDLASGATADRWQRIEAEKKHSYFKDVINLTLDALVNSWPHPDLGEEYRSPLVSNVRTLFMSGTLDFNTPPHQAEEIRWGFSNSSHIIVDNAGHEQVVGHPGAPQAMIKFLKGENVDDVALFYPKLKFIPVVGEDSDVFHPSMEK